MGLDMYLERKKKGDSEWSEAAYWRKANAVRDFFVRECGGNYSDNCVRYAVSKGLLVKLQGICDTLLRKADKFHKDDEGMWVAEDADNWSESQPHEFTALAEKLLPACAGCFFGSLDYDMLYANKLAYTHNTIQKILSGWSGEGESKDDQGYEYSYTDWW